MTESIEIAIHPATDGMVAEVRFGPDFNNSTFFIASNTDDLLRKIANYINTLSDLETE